MLDDLTRILKKDDKWKNMVSLFHLECLLEGQELFLARILLDATVRILVDLLGHPVT
jgi:hypothetical protein